MLGYDIYWLSRMVKRLTGRTYKELLQIKRLNQAAFLLLNTRLAVADVLWRWDMTIPVISIGFLRRGTRCRRRSIGRITGRCEDTVLWHISLLLQLTGLPEQEEEKRNSCRDTGYEGEGL